MSKAFRSLILSALPAAIAACSSSTESNSGEAPILPSANSMRADLSLFDQTGASASGAAAIGGTHFAAAAFSVTVANAVTALVMAVPVATFAAAASQEPVLEGDAYHWRYSTVVHGQSFAADLSGRGSGANSLWEMRISASGANPPLNDFLYYSGAAALSGESGTWTIFDAGQPSANRQLLRIDWTHANATSWRVAFINVAAGTPENGDRLTYEVSGDARSVTFLDASAAATTVVEWHAATHTGSIHTPGYNGGAKACWNTLLQNVTCN
jgi:hypothetical protein